MMLWDHKQRKVTFPDYPEKIRFYQKFPKMWPKMLKNGSKDFLDILVMIRGHYCAQFAENRMSWKIPDPDLWTEK